MIFENLTSQQLQGLMDDYLINIEFNVSRKTLGFENIEKQTPGVELNQTFLGPYSFDNPNLISKMRNEIKDENWVFVLLKTYVSGGHLVYKKIEENRFGAKIIWR
jgi:hypothetical protein